MEKKELVVTALPPARHQAELSAKYTKEAGKLIVTDWYPRKETSPIHEDDFTLIVATDQKGSKAKLMLLSALIGFAKDSGLKEDQIFTKKDGKFKLKANLKVEFGPNLCKLALN